MNGPCEFIPKVKPKKAAAGLVPAASIAVTITAFENFFIWFPPVLLCQIIQLLKNTGCKTGEYGTATKVTILGFLLIGRQVTTQAD